jgi:hypothetical protein
MKIKELQDIEKEVIKYLLTRSAGGDNEASRVLLEHLREVGSKIDEWRHRKDEAKIRP